MILSEVISPKETWSSEAVEKFTSLPSSIFLMKKHARFCKSIPFVCSLHI